MGERFWSKVNKTSSCWLWIACLGDDGYGNYSLNNKTVRAHRYSYFIHKGDIADGLVVRHTCDEPKCVNPDHLILGTIQDNVNDKYERGRQAIINGEKHGMAKLTEDDIIEIRILKGFGFLNRELAKRFNVSESSMSLILKGKRWSHI